MTEPLSPEELDALPFEQALEKLENLVSRMETGRHPLEEILCAVYIQRLDGCWDGSYPFRRCVHALHPIAPF